MQVRYDERVATYIGLEPCAVAREGGGEASVEEHTGQPLSLAKILIPGAETPLRMRKATRVGARKRASRRPGVVEEPGMCGNSLLGNREIPRLTRRNKQLWYASGR